VGEQIGAALTYRKRATFQDEGVSEGGPTAKSQISIIPGSELLQNVAKEKGSSLGAW